MKVKLKEIILKDGSVVKYSGISSGPRTPEPAMMSGLRISRYARWPITQLDWVA